MMIELHLTGNERKGLVKAVSEIIGAPSEYQYMPPVHTKSAEITRLQRKAILKSVIQLTARKSKI